MPVEKKPRLAITEARLNQIVKEEILRAELHRMIDEAEHLEEGPVWDTIKNLTGRGVKKAGEKVAGAAGKVGSAVGGAAKKVGTAVSDVAKGAKQQWDKELIKNTLIHSGQAMLKAKKEIQKTVMDKTGNEELASVIAKGACTFAQSDGKEFGNEAITAVKNIINQLKTKTSKQQQAQSTEDDQARETSTGLSARRA